MILGTETYRELEEDLAKIMGIEVEMQKQFLMIEKKKNMQYNVEDYMKLR